MWSKVLLGPAMQCSKYNLCLQHRHPTWPLVCIAALPLQIQFLANISGEAAGGDLSACIQLYLHVSLHLHGTCLAISGRLMLMDSMP